MLTQLPEQADPVRLCEQDKSYHGRVALQELARLAPLLTSSEGEAAFSLRFDHDEEGRARVRGNVQATLSVCCQRCMDSMQLEVDADFLLSPVEGPEEAVLLPPDYDPLLLEERRLHPMDLIEDELILAVPPAPHHAEADCGVDLAGYRLPERPDGDETEQEDNPFAILTQLKRDTE